jgi:hypothetical protein
VERVVHITFGTHVALDSVASWVTAVAACGVVRSADVDDRTFIVRVRRAGAMEYLQTLLAEGVKRGVLAWQLAAP